MFGYGLNKVEWPGFTDLHDYSSYLSVVDRIFEGIVEGRQVSVCGKLHINREPLLHGSLFGCHPYRGNAVDTRDEDLVHANKAADYANFADSIRAIRVIRRLIPPAHLSVSSNGSRPAKPVSTSCQ